MEPFRTIRCQLNGGCPGLYNSPPDPSLDARESLEQEIGLDDEPGSAATSGKAPRTGKKFVPEFFGSTPMRDYARRVRLFEASTGIDPEYRAQKLMERLTGQAWLATETINLESLKNQHGVNRLLDHLWQELEPLELLKVFSTLEEFYKTFKRARGQDFTSFDTAFRAQLQRLEEVGAGISGTTKAFWFVEKACISAELRKQVVAASGGVYDYAKLRAALVAIVPQVGKQHSEEPNTNGAANAHGRRGDPVTPARSTPSTSSRTRTMTRTSTTKPRTWRTWRQN